MLMISPISFCSQRNAALQNSGSTLHQHLHQHAHIQGDFINIAGQSRDRNASFISNAKNALLDGVHIAIKNIPQTIIGQLCLLGLGTGIKFIVSSINTQTNPHKKIDLCTELLDSAFDAKQANIPKSYKFNLKKYRAEMCNIKKLSPKGLKTLSEHIQFLDQESEQTLADWQRKNHSRLTKGKPSISYEKYLEQLVQKSSAAEQAV